MDPPSSSSSNTRNYSINNTNSNQDNPLSFLIPTYTTAPLPTTTSYIPNYNPDNNITTNPTATTNVSPSSSSHPPPPPPPSRGSLKKRTRASRRAPTTVLSTDTSNFRAMVQEFTGFPSPPFPSNSSPSIHSFNHLFSRSSSFPTSLHHNFTATPPTSFSPSSILHAIASSNPAPISTAAATPSYPPNMLMFNNATPSSISNLTHIPAGGSSSAHVQGLGQNVASAHFGDLSRVLVGASNNGDPDRCDDDDDSSTREDKRRKTVFDSWNDRL